MSKHLPPFSRFTIKLSQVQSAAANASWLLSTRSWSHLVSRWPYNMELRASFFQSQDAFSARWAFVIPSSLQHPVLPLRQLLLRCHLRVSPHILPYLLSTIQDFLRYWPTVYCKAWDATCCFAIFGPHRAQPWVPRLSPMCPPQDKKGSPLASSSISWTSSTPPTWTPLIGKNAQSTSCELCFICCITEDSSPGGSQPPSDSSEGLFERDKGGARIYRGFWKKTKQKPKKQVVEHQKITAGTSLVVQWLESAAQCRGHGFEPWSVKIPHAAEQLSPCATTTEPASHNYWSLHA